MPSVSATLVQPPVQVQAREETIFAPGAAPFIFPPNRPLAAVMPATWVPMLGLDDADADVVGLRPGGVVDDVLAGLHHERDALGDVRRRVVGAEVPDLEGVLVRLHRGVVGEVQVVVRVDPDGAGGRVVQHAPGVGGVAVPVEVALLVTACGGGLVQVVELVRALGRRELLGALRGGADGEGGARDTGGHPPPGAVAVGDGVGRGHPVDDLPLAGGGLLQRRVAEVDAGVQDADGDAAAVRLRVVLDEVDGTGLEGRVVRVLRRGLLARCGVGDRAARGPGAAGRRVVQRDLLLEVDGPDGGEPDGGGDGRVRPARRHGGADVAELVVGTAHRAALDRVQLLGDPLGLPGRGRDHQRDVLVAVGLGLGEQGRRRPNPACRGRT